MCDKWRTVIEPTIVLILGSDRISGARVEEAAVGVLRLPRPLAQEERVLLRLRRRRELVQQRPARAGRTCQVSREYESL